MSISEKDILVCLNCGKETLRKSAVQKYCRPCSALKDRERKTKWQREHRPNAQPRDPEKYGRDQKRKIEVGAEASQDNQVKLTWITDSHIEEEIVKTKRVSVPFNPKFSKNALWNTTSKGHVYIRQEINDARDQLIAAIQHNPFPDEPDKEWFEGKVWLDIFVMKPNARFDAVNVIDFVCDAVKKAINVDDRWFCIQRLDWSIVKKNPMVIIGISQAVTEHHRVCSYCGSIKPTTEFGKNKSMRFGVGRECKKCIASARTQKQREKGYET